MKRLIMVAVALALVACSERQPTAARTDVSFSQAGTQGFDQYGYNNTARIFNGTGASWCLERGASADCLGAYSPDKLVMKWNAEWDRGIAEGWSTPPYAAWENNEWNGNCEGCSGAVWHYKIKWIGPCGADNTPLADGGYCIWGQFETLMDQGHDPNLGTRHIWFALARPNGYGN